jgi:hypothetical protein
MRLSTLISTISLTSLTSARIIGLAAPSTLTPNSTFTLTLLTENYIQSVSDIAVVWGYQTPTPTNPQGYPYTLGRFANSSYLGPESSNTLENVTIQAVVPEGLEEGEQVLGVAVMSLYGASSGPVTFGWNVTVKVRGGQDDEDLLSSTVEGEWGVLGLRRFEEVFAIGGCFISLYRRNTF